MSANLLTLNMIIRSKLNSSCMQMIYKFSRERVSNNVKRACYSPRKEFSSKCAVENAVTPITGNPRDENHRIRMNLALSYRILNRLNLNEGVCNHLTAMAPCKENDSKETMLVIPGRI